jgi:hypothetical protein
MKTNSPLPFALLFKSIARYIKRKPVLSFLLLASLCMNVSAQNSANIIITPASTTTSVGQNFVVNVRVDFTTAPGTSSVDAVEIHLNFDKTKLAVTSITKPASAVLPTEAIPLQSISTINTNGRINYAATTSSGFPNADFDFLTVTFNVIAGGGSTTPLTYLTTFPNKTDAQRLGSSILGSVSNGTVDITTCTAPTATISAASGASICNGQPVALTLSNATGVSPYSLIVNGTTYPATVGNVFATIPFPTYKIWPSTNPAVARQNDGTAIETGNKFRSSQTGFVKGVRFYNGTGSYTLGTYKGKLWNFNTGALLGTVTYTGVAAGAWFEAMFATPVSIAANTTYLVTTYSSAGNYAATDNYFSSAVTNGPLTALANSTSANGMYITGTEQTGTTNFSNWQQFLSTNYWADVIFTPNTNSFALTSVTDASGCNVTGSLQTVNVLSVDCSTLPVTLLNLSASPGSRKVTLRWATSSEINNRGFDVQRSDDGVTWVTVGFVAGAGNSNSTINYTYLDNNLDGHKYYYRLRQIDIDSRYKFSMIVSATLDSKGEYSLGQNYPNPFANQTTIQFTLPKSENVNLSLYDANGRVLKVLVNAKKEAGTHAINLNTENLSRGIYFYRIMAGDFMSMKKMTIQ